MIVTDPLGSQGIRRKGMVSPAKTKDPTTSCLRITITSAIEFFARRQECTSKSICRIVMKNDVLASVPTIRPSRMSWEDLWELGLNL